MKDEIKRKDKVINSLLDNFSNRVPDHSIALKPEHQTKNNIHISTAGNNHRIIVASEKKKTKKNTLISPNFLVRKFCGKAQFPHSFGPIARNYEETVPFHKISTPEN